MTVKEALQQNKICHTHKEVKFLVDMGRIYVNNRQIKSFKRVVHKGDTITRKDLMGNILATISV